jgi:hypothetical protein
LVQSSLPKFSLVRRMSLFSISKSYRPQGT